MLKKTNNVQNSLQNNMKEELKEEKTNLEDVCKDFRMNILNPPKEKSDRMPTEEQLYKENKLLGIKHLWKSKEGIKQNPRESKP